jgi:hypothetical protein
MDELVVEGCPGVTHQQRDGQEATQAVNREG